MVVEVQEVRRQVGLVQRAEDLYLVVVYLEAVVAVLDGEFGVPVRQGHVHLPPLIRLKIVAEHLAEDVVVAGDSAQRVEIAPEHTG